MQHFVRAQRKLFGLLTTIFTLNLYQIKLGGWFGTEGNFRVCGEILMELGKNKDLEIG